ncbi:hypothetical protein CBR_g48129 [Chara braunii]|uniref:ALA-interacting subunit n=1 Tax=Chara braunii TaxID=69332 RepID=A0A388M291_CHABU|nr:hypothetical protein CBR_g48129 [Chara braunii]|eukprot:GBG88599.1 hypothetical protein CBR_g48129 [Chara braunii]
MPTAAAAAAMPRSSAPAESPMTSSTPSTTTTTTATTAGKKKSRRPKENPFLQQELPACYPVVTINVAIAFLFGLGCLLIPIGAIALFASNSIVEVVSRYDDACLTRFPPNSSSTTCELYLSIPKTMHKPIYIYYELDNFYQNHRRYVSSYSRDELLGLSVSRDSRERSCRPQDVVRGVDGNPIQPLTPIIPCGLIAWSRFNDSFSFGFSRGMISESSSPLNVIKEGISWISDREKFSNTPFVESEGNESESARIERRFDGATLREDEDLMVWMRISPFSKFRKLWGKLDRTLREGDKLQVNISNQYNSYGFNGNKKLVLSTSGWLGGANLFLAAAYLVTGAFCLSASVCFLFLRWLFPRNFGEESNLSWNWLRAANDGVTEVIMFG